MIRGILLGVSLSVTLASLGVILIGTTGAIKTNYVTGAVIGTNELVSHAVTVFLISLIVTLMLVLVMKNRAIKTKK